MTVVEVCRYRGFPISVCARGHSGYADSGSDIVCAAISVLMQTLHIGLVDVLGLKPHVLVDAPKAFIKLTWDERYQYSEVNGSVIQQVCKNRGGVFINAFRQN